MYIKCYRPNLINPYFLPVYDASHVGYTQNKKWRVWSYNRRKKALRGVSDDVDNSKLSSVLAQFKWFQHDNKIKKIPHDLRLNQW